MQLFREISENFLENAQSRDYYQVKLSARSGKYTKNQLGKRFLHSWKQYIETLQHFGIGLIFTKSRAGFGI